MDASTVRRRRKDACLALDCSNEEFRTIEASLYQVLHRTTANEPVIIVQTNTMFAGLRSAARDCKEIRSEEHVRHKFSIDIADQQHL